MEAPPRRWGMVLFLLVASIVLVYLGWMGEPEPNVGTGREDTAAEKSKDSESAEPSLASNLQKGGQNAPREEHALTESAAEAVKGNARSGEELREQGSFTGVEFKVCAYTPGSRARLLEQWRTRAQQEYDIRIGLKPYTSETEALEDYRDRQCAAAFLPGKLLRELNRYSYTISAFGALPKPGMLQNLVREIRKEHNRARLGTWHGEVLGLLPTGSARLVTRKGKFQDLDHLKGMEVAVDFGQALDLWASSFEIRLFPTDDAADMNLVFKHESDAMIATPAQLSRFDPGQARDGLAILETPLFQRTRQLVVHEGVWSDEFRVFTRRYFDNVLLDRALAEVRAAREAYSARFFSLTESERARLLAKLRDLRQSVREQGHYDADMLLLLKEIRCRRVETSDPPAPDC